ncbi:MAG: Hsp20/alpha crystallin family protein [Armatimonadetes bacterium]|nr:Hsp20/alpha crystallin family protein [Armatimonadota bacterium]
MYISTLNPNQTVAFSQGFQSGATAFPVSLRTGMPGTTVTYSFNPALSSAAMGINPFIAQNPLLHPFSAINLPGQLAVGAAMPAGINPFLSQALAFSPAMTTAGLIPGASVNPFFNPAGAAAWVPAQTIQSSAGMAQMRVDLAETNSDVVVACELPNVSLNDLSLTVTDDSMTISATAWAGNRPTSLFRTIALPTSIRSEQVEATYANGILEIRAPKSDVATRRKVKINVAQ